MRNVTAAELDWRSLRPSMKIPPTSLVGFRGAGMAVFAFADYLRLDPGQSGASVGDLLGNIIAYGFSPIRRNRSA